MDKSRIFAKLLLELKNEPADIVAELELFDEAMKAGLDKLMLNPVISVEKKEALVDKLFKDNISLEIKEFIGYLIKSYQVESLAKIIKSFEKVAKNKKGMEKVEIVSARKLSENQIALIKESIEKVFKIKPVISNTVDEDVLAGVAIKIGDKIFDNTLNHQINELDRQLMI